MIKARRNLPTPTTSDLFDRFDRDNPHVFRTIVRLARKARGEGHEQMGIALLYNVARWELRLQTTTEGEGWRLNDHYQAYYARKVMLECPDLADFFAVRRSEADAWAEQHYGTAA